MAPKRDVVPPSSTPTAGVDPTRAQAIAIAKGEPPAHDDVSLAKPATYFVCGLEKVGPSRYALVSGRVVDGVPDLVVDPISQTLDLAADLLRTEFQKLMETIP